MYWKRAGQTRYRLNRIGIPSGHKRCGRCKEVKLFKKFTFNSRTDDGYANACRKCNKIKWTEFISQPGMRKKLNTKQSLRAQGREYKDRKNKHQNIIRNHRLKTDPGYKLSEGIRRSIGMSLKKRGGSKRGYHWEDLVGWLLDDLTVQFERQFKATPPHIRYGKMSWENYPEWHIDHIIPISAFNFTRPEHIDFKRCWALSNLRPMWAAEHLSKGAKLDKPFQPALAIEVS